MYRVYHPSKSKPPGPVQPGFPHTGGGQNNFTQHRNPVSINGNEYSHIWESQHSDREPGTIKLDHYAGDVRDNALNDECTCPYGTRLQLLPPTEGHVYNLLPCSTLPRYSTSTKTREPHSTLDSSAALKLANNSSNPESDFMPGQGSRYIPLEKESIEFSRTDSMTENPDIIPPDPEV